MAKKRRRSAPYDVGYCRPPEDHRFQPGRSGNPYGRPRKARNHGPIVVQILDATTGSGRNRKSTFETMVTDLVDHAIAGQVPSLLQVFRYMQAFDTLDEPSAVADEDEVFDLEAIRAMIRGTDSFEDKAMWPENKFPDI